MRGPAGWAEPGQRPEFDEFTLVLGGVLVVEHEGGTLEVTAGRAVERQGLTIGAPVEVVPRRPMSSWADRRL